MLAGLTMLIYTMENERLMRIEERFALHITDCQTRRKAAIMRAARAVGRGEV